MNVPPDLDPALFGPDYFLGEILDLQFAAAVAGLPQIEHWLAVAAEEARNLIRRQEEDGSGVPEAERWRSAPLQSR